jgi:hypothetical protein
MITPCFTGEFPHRPERKYNVVHSLQAAQIFQIIASSTKYTFTYEIILARVFVRYDEIVIGNKSCIAAVLMVIGYGDISSLRRAVPRDYQTIPNSVQLFPDNRQWVHPATNRGKPP